MSEVVPDPMEGEQTWPTQEELEEAECKKKVTYIRSMHAHVHVHVHVQ